MTKSQRNLYRILEKKSENAHRLAEMFHNQGDEKTAYSFACESMTYQEVMFLLEDEDFLKSSALICGVTLEE